MEFIEAPLFTKYVFDYLSEEEYAAFQWKLATSPKTGDLIPRSGGLRKIRWGSKGKGKSGGVRIIYYYLDKRHQIHLLTIYNKSDVTNISGPILKKIKEELMNNDK